MEETMIDFETFAAGRAPMARETEHFAYSNVFLASRPSGHLLVIRSEGPIGFGDMVEYFTQADPFEDFVNESGVEQTGEPLSWFYWNDADQPRDPGGNPVREPFRFEVGYPIAAPPAPLHRPSPTRGSYESRPLEALEVASVFYRGSFPHQEHSGFAEAWMTLVTSAPDLGYTLTGRLYREIYHHLDYERPEQSISEVQVEIERTSDGGAIP